MFKRPKRKYFYRFFLAEHIIIWSVIVFLRGQKYRSIRHDMPLAYRIIRTSKRSNTSWSWSHTPLSCSRSYDMDWPCFYLESTSLVNECLTLCYFPVQFIHQKGTVPPWSWFYLLLWLQHVMWYGLTLFVFQVDIADKYVFETTIVWRKIRVPIAILNEIKTGKRLISLTFLLVARVVLWTDIVRVSEDVDSINIWEYAMSISSRRKPRCETSF